jgi:hypothetical protein
MPEALDDKHTHPCEEEMKTGNIWKDRGNYKIYFDRWRNYLGSVQFLMIALMFVLQTNIRWWWILVGFALSIVGMWFDIRYILSAEYEAQQRKNWELTGRMLKIDEIHTMLKELTEKK